MNMGFPQSLLREVLDISIENGCKCTLKITVSGDFDNSPIEKTWDITLESIYSTQSYKIEGLPGGVELSVVVAILLDDEAYYKSNTAKVTLTEDKQISVKLSKVGSLADVSDLKAEVKDSNVFLTWTDPNIAKLFGMEVTYTSTNGSSSSTNNTTGRTILPAMETGSLFVAPGNGGIAIADLEAGTYTFTVRSMDVNGSKSAGVSVEATVEEATEPTSLDVTVSPSTTEMTNQEITVTITMTANSEDATTAISELYYAKGLLTTADEVTQAENCQKLTPSQTSDTVQTASFTVSENGIYTIFATAQNGETAFKYISISNIYTLPPDDVSDLTALVRNSDVFLSWTDPTADNLFGMEVTYTSTSGASSSNSNGTDRAILPTMETGSYFVAPGNGGTVMADLEAGTYTFTVKTMDVNGSKSDGVSVTATVESSSVTANNGQVLEVSLSTSQIDLADVTSDSTSMVTVKGTNFNQASSIKVQLYDSDGNQTGNSLDIDNSRFSQATTSFSTNLSIPQSDDFYTVKVLIDDVVQSRTASLHVYSAPSFSEFTMPTSVGNAASGKTVTASVKGKNFKNPNINATSDFLITCSDDGGAEIVDGASVTVEDDNLLNVNLKIPSQAKVYTVKISCGEASQEGTFTVNATNSYEVGDIVLADKTTVKADAYSADADNPAVGVIAFINDKGWPVVLGLQQSESTLQWALDESTGYNTKFTDIIVKYSDSSGSYTFTGDLDGSDNWDVICSVDPEGSATPATNYPAFNYAVTYGTTAGLSETTFANGWYMPSLAELLKVYDNMSTLQTSLTVADGFSFNNYCYWTSSQSIYDVCVYYVFFSNGNFGVSYGKAHYNYVLVLHTFVE